MATYFSYRQRNSVSHTHTHTHTHTPSWALLFALHYTGSCFVYAPIILPRKNAAAIDIMQAKTRPWAMGTSDVGCNRLQHGKYEPCRSDTREDAEDAKQTLKALRKSTGRCSTASFPPPQDSFAAMQCAHETILTRSRSRGLELGCG